MNELQLPPEAPRLLMVRNSSWWGFIATTVALMLLAAGATAYMVNISTGGRARPTGIPLSVGTPTPPPLTPRDPVVLSGPVGGLPRTAMQTVSLSQLPDVDRPRVVGAEPPAPTAPSAPATPVEAELPPAPPVPAPPVPVSPPPSSPEGVVSFVVGTVDGVLDLVLS